MAVNRSSSDITSFSSATSATSITASKQAKLILTAQHWLAAHPKHARHPCRFDVVSYDGPTDDIRREWLRGAFEAG